jgi:Uma2 family endonuclease
MASMIAPEVVPDTSASFEINPGTLLQFLETRPESGPRLKCYQGSVTLVSPGRSHGMAVARLDLLILAVCLELRVSHTALRSTTWTLPAGAGDTAYEADLAYYIQSFGTEDDHHPPDLAVEIVVTHPERKALLAGALLGISELWVLDVPGHRLTFHHLATRGKARGTYRARPTSRAFPALRSEDVLERLDDPEPDDVAFHENCRDWARRALAPHARPPRRGD